MIKKGWITSFILIATDLLGIYLVFYIAFLLRKPFTPLIGLEVKWSAVTPLARLGVIVCIMIFAFQRLYPGYGLTAVKELERMGNSVTLSFFLLAAISFLVKSFHIFPRSILLIGWLICFFSLPLLHFFVRNLLSRTKWYGVPVIIYGELPWANEVAYSLKRVRRMGWIPQRVISMSDIELQRIAEYKAQILVLAFKSNTIMKDLTRNLALRFRRIVLVEQGNTFGSLWIEPRDLDGRLGLEFNYHLLEKHNQWIKRIIDICLSSILLVLLSPVIGVIALLIAVDSPGPVFFRQKRLGQKLRLIKIIKFRTMVVNAEEKLEQLLQEDPDIDMQFKTYHKIEDDPRVTKIGRILRKYSLDELPQFWNVLVGEMSLVGPRAYLPFELGEVGTYKHILFQIKPGITGWWQILGRHNTTFKHRLQMDEYYISNWSLWMDTYVILKTVWIVLIGGGV